MGGLARKFAYIPSKVIANRVLDDVDEGEARRKIIVRRKLLGKKEVMVSVQHLGLCRFIKLLGNGGYRPVYSDLRIFQFTCVLVT